MGNTPRFTYNGKQLDRELNWQDYGLRESDAITERFVSVDPLTGKYPELTPYQYASDRPIEGIDLDGMERSNNANQSEKAPDLPSNLYDQDKENQAYQKYNPHK